MRHDFTTGLLLLVCLFVFTGNEVEASEPGAEDASIQTNTSEESKKPFTTGGEPGWFLMGGLTGGVTFAKNSTAGFVGAELSFVRLLNGFWIGAYGDIFYDFAQDAAVVTLGPELGYEFFGIDGGLGLKMGSEGAEAGGQARLILTMGILGLYGRYGIWPLKDETEHTAQVGILLKFPLMAPRY